jgi:hypothetical protein
VSHRSFDLEQLEKKRQENLINFLNADLDLGFTFVETARRRGPDHTDYIQALEKARKIVQAIRQFEGSIGDPGIWHAIHERANELNKLIDTL